jgi:DNA-binding NarL/FixJ family response regulator
MRAPGDLIRVIIVDDHPAMRAGVRAVLEPTSELALVGEAGSPRDLGHVLEHTAPHVVLMDFHLPEENGLVLCHRLKRSAPTPRVVVYSAYADESLVAPALLAQADAVMAKHASAATLIGTLREVVREPREPLELPADQRERLIALLEPEDVALAGLLLLRTSAAEIARTTRLHPGELTERIEGILRRVSAARERLR